MSYGLTAPQSALLAFIRAEIKTSGRPPTVAEMTHHLGHASRASAHRILGELEARGYIRRLPRKARAIELVEPKDDPAMARQIRECLLRLKTECEAEGLADRAGFDAWLAWANELLGTSSAKLLADTVEGVRP